MKISGLLLFLIPILVLATGEPCCADAISSRCKSSTYKDNNFTQMVNNFAIYEKVYLYVYCEVLPKGSYAINTQWMDRNGMLQSERAQEFRVEFPRGHSAAFKFKQMPKGTLRQMMSGDDFDDFQYGRWSVLVFINNEKIDRNYFTITK